MKANVHPTYYPDAKIICACGNEMTVGSTVKEIRVELCANCHPFYTGKKVLIDTEGRVEKFKKKTEIKDSKKSVLGKKAKTEKRAKAKAEKRAAKQPEMLIEE
ncbi:MAG TPA: 50S ribosomal protein L31 [bacterium]|nr:MAG: 50S ribosomal protein L31 [Parcubacteria group bacterium ADurb.Bin192]HPN14497.1 50S ribosomal protein L31 [bacterium]